MVLSFRIHSFAESARRGTLWYVNVVILVLSLTVSSENIDASTAPDYVPEGLRSDKHVTPSVTADEKESYRESTVSATAELLRGMRDSASAFGPLKSIARFLCFILDNCEVRPPLTFDSRCL